MGLDLTVADNRKNILRKFQQLENICIHQHQTSQQVFELLFQAWEKFSGPLWFLCYWNDYFKCSQLILKAAKATKNIEVEAQLLSEIGWAYMEWEELAEAQEYFNQSLHLYQSIKDVKRECRLWRYFGVLSFRKKSFHSALNFYQQALRIVQENYTQEIFDEKWAFQEAELPNLIGNVYLELHQLNKSHQQLHLSLENYQRLGEKWAYYQASPLLNLGKLYWRTGDFDRAKFYYQECLNLSHKISRTDTMAGVLLEMAQLAEAENQYEQAIQLASEAERVAGTEIRAVRDHAATYKEKLLNLKHSMVSRKMP